MQKIEAPQSVKSIGAKSNSSINCQNLSAIADAMADGLFVGPTANGALESFRS